MNRLVFISIILLSLASISWQKDNRENNPFDLILLLLESKSGISHELVHELTTDSCVYVTYKEGIFPLGSQIKRRLQNGKCLEICAPEVIFFHNIQKWLKISGYTMNDKKAELSFDIVYNYVIKKQGTARFVKKGNQWKIKKVNVSVVEK